MSRGGLGAWRDLYRRLLRLLPARLRRTRSDELAEVFRTMFERDRRGVEAGDAAAEHDERARVGFAAAAKREDAVPVRIFRYAYDDVLAVKNDAVGLQGIESGWFDLIAVGRIVARMMPRT
ncbi:MAG: hypothetical protein KY453_09660, partial [Gemmatimonadetes bacterium]|nr:hypothetical protein [Gemmatimonadota bacterium]